MAKRTGKALSRELIDSQGVVIYRGPSMIDPRVEIVCIATGFVRDSDNAKTGPMVQTWIFRADMSPLESSKLGADSAQCGGCQHRGRLIGGVLTGRSCYVNLGQGPRSIYVTFIAGDYATATADQLAELGSGEIIRLGAYGDPAAVPVHIWDALLSRSAGHTGYSHQWKSARLRDVTRHVQASVDSEREAAQAVALGLGYFRVKAPSTPMLPGEVYCPADMPGSTVQCRDCQACNGKGARIVIDVHGSGSSNFTKRSLPTLEVA